MSIDDQRALTQAECALDSAKAIARKFHDLYLRALARGHRNVEDVRHARDIAELYVRECARACRVVARWAPANVEAESLLPGALTQDQAAALQAIRACGTAGATDLHVADFWREIELLCRLGLVVREERFRENAFHLSAAGRRMANRSSAARHLHANPDRPRASGRQPQGA